jgi:hypothetical protein
LLKTGLLVSTSLVGRRPVDELTKILHSPMLLHMGVSGGAVTVRYCGTIDARVSRGTKQGRSLMVVASRLGRHKENGVRSRRRRSDPRCAYGKPRSHYPTGRNKRNGSRKLTDAPPEKTMGAFRFWKSLRLRACARDISTSRRLCWHRVAGTASSCGAVVIQQLV